MNVVTRMYKDPLSIDDRLQQMGLTRESFRTSAEKSFTAYAECTSNDPPTFAGIAAWAAANRSLRESLILAGWTRKNETNQPLVVNASNTIAITASSGDESTGRDEEFPSTRSSKGARTRDYIERNQMTFAFPGDPAPIVKSLAIPGRSTWLFLIHRDQRLKELRYELSLPTAMDDEGNVKQWAERIIFPPTPIEIEDITVSEAQGGQSPEITVEIIRRAN